jgi:Tfp pilus assembly protein PilX
MNMKTAKIIAKKVRKYAKKLHKQTGAALAVVSLILLVLTILIVSSHYTTIVQTTSSANYRDTSQAFYVAEAGVQRTIDWFSHRYADSTLLLQPSPSSPPDWPAITSPNNIPTGTLGSGDTLYPNRMSNGNLVVLSTVSGQSTFPTVTKTSGATVNMVSDFQTYLNSTNTITSTATGTNLQGTYQVTATLLSTKLVSGFTGPSQRIERWKISSIGTWGTTATVLARAENTAVIETLTIPLFSHAICANSFDFNGSPDIDSYSSAIGAFASPSSNQNGTTSVGTFVNSTGPFDRGNVTLMSLTPTAGQFDVPTSYQPGLGCGSAVNCGQNFCPVLPAIPTFTIPSFTSGTAASNQGLGGVNGSPYTAITGACTTTCPTPPSLSSCTACARDVTGGTIKVASGATGDQSFWAQTVSGNVTIDNLTGRSSPGALNIYVQSMSNNSQDITVMSNKDNPVNIYITGDFDFKGNARFNSPSGSEGLNTEGLKVFATTTGAFTLGSSGNTNITGIVYAPNASAVVNGTGDFYGVIISNTFRKNGTSGGVHFDRQLANDYQTIFGYVPQTQVRRIY